MPSTLTPVQAITLEIENKLAVAKLVASPTLRALNARGAMKTARQTQIKWDVEVGGGVAAIEAVTADGADTATDAVVAASLPIGAYRIKHQFRVSKVDMQEAANTAPTELRNLFSAHVERGVINILRTLNDLIFTGDGTNTDGQIVGLEKIADNTLTYPSWAALVNTNATARALSRDLLYAIDEVVKTQESFYDLIVSTPRICTNYKKLFDTTRPLEFVYNNEGLPNADVGLGGVTYNGRPVLEDPQCTPGTIYFLNSMDMQIYTFLMEAGPSSQIGMQAQSSGEIGSTNVFGLNFNVSELPSNNSAVRKFEIYVLPQVKCHNRKSLTVLDKLQTT
jgi:hypothetical protein